MGRCSARENPLGLARFVFGGYFPGRRLDSHGHRIWQKAVIHGTFTEGVDMETQVRTKGPR